MGREHFVPQLAAIASQVQTVQPTLNAYTEHPDSMNGSSTLAFVASTLNQLQALLAQIVGGMR